MNRVRRSIDSGQWRSLCDSPRRMLRSWPLFPCIMIDGLVLWSATALTRFTVSASTSSMSKAQSSSYKRQVRGETRPLRLHSIGFIAAVDGDVVIYAVSVVNT